MAVKVFGGVAKRGDLWSSQKFSSVILPHIALVAGYPVTQPGALRRLTPLSGCGPVREAAGLRRPAEDRLQVPR